MFHFKDHQGKEAAIVLNRIVGLNLLNPDAVMPEGTVSAISIDAIAGLFCVPTGESFEEINRRYKSAILPPWDLARPEPDKPPA
jgi:hypothetical protein